MIGGETTGTVAGSSRTRPPRSRRTLLLLGTVVTLLVIALLALGTWQVRRLAWKQALIARVDARVHAPPAPAPGPHVWPLLTPDDAAYRHVRVTGRWIDTAGTRTQAVTVRGSGYWLMAPLRTDTGFTVLINRGFVPDGRIDTLPAAGPVTVTGLLRLSEPGGGFLRRNDPAADRWYSRDVAAIAAARRVGTVAPYFIDASAGGMMPDRPPIGGLTVVAFPNNHLTYAITWYILALMLGGGWVMILRHEHRLR